MNYTITLFNVNEVLSGPFETDATPDGLSETGTGFDWTTGLGTLKWTSPVATILEENVFIAFFDHEIDEATNTFFNETGSTSGSLATGQSWEIDDPWFDRNTDSKYIGNIFWNVFDSERSTGSLLENINGDDLALSEVPPGSPERLWPDDVSMAMGWDFLLDIDETATITLLLSTSAPASGFYLQQTDSDTGSSIFFSSTLEIGDGSAVVPIPSAILLLGSGLAGLAGLRKKSATANIG